MPKKKPNIKVRSAAKAPPSLPIGILRAAVISLGCGMLALPVVCMALLGTADPGAYAPLAASLLSLPIALLCGILSARQSSLGGLVSGVLGGALLCLFLLGLGLLWGNTGVAYGPLASLPLRAGLCLFLSALGGYSVTHRKPKVRRHRP